MLAYVYAVGVLLALALAAAVVRHVEGADGRWIAVLRSRFLYGVPWGTLVTVAFVLGVYLFVQDGWSNWNDPVTIPFRAWSYFYPTGVLSAAFAHNSSGHIVNNLTSTIVLAPIAEYFWSHYPPDQRSGRSHAEAPMGETFRPNAGNSGWLSNPYVRAFVIFPAAAIGVGLLTAVFAIGPIIGFSGVVFAFGGFALIRYPITTVVALLVTSVVRTIHRALADPVVVATVSASPPSPPSWATIAVQGHALGMLLGVLLGLALLWHRGQRPAAGRLFLATVIYATARSLWAVYWFQGEGTYVLYRGIGVALVALLALLVVVAAAASDRTLPKTARYVDGGFSGRQIAFVLILLGTAAISGPAIVANVSTVENGAVPGEGHVTVQDYTVTYEEGVQNQMIPVIDLPGVQNATNVRTSGVIVVNEDRNIWTRSISRTRLENTGSERVQVGGVGWRGTVDVERTGWRVAGNSTVYAVDLSDEDGNAVRSFTAEPSRAEPTIGGHNVTIAVDNDEFELQVSRNGQELGSTPIPEPGNETTAGELRLVVEEDDDVAVFAELDDTRVRIAQQETYD